LNNRGIFVVSHGTGLKKTKKLAEANLKRINRELPKELAEKKFEN
jgi:hypothetical protein